MYNCSTEDGVGGNLHSRIMYACIYIHVQITWLVLLLRWIIPRECSSYSLTNHHRDLITTVGCFSQGKHTASSWEKNLLHDQKWWEEKCVLLYPPCSGNGWKGKKQTGKGKENQIAPAFSGDQAPEKNCWNSWLWYYYGQGKCSSSPLATANKVYFPTGYI